MSSRTQGEMSDEEFERRLQNLRDFDLSPVTKRLEFKEDLDNAEELEAKFRRFAKMQLERPDDPIAPSRAIDKYWHALILDTRRYHKFCDQVFGEYLHHVPGDPSERDQDEYRERIENDESEDADAFCHSHVGTPTNK